MTNEDTTDFDEHFAKISSYIVDTLHGVPLEMTEDEKEQFRMQVTYKVEGEPLEQLPDAYSEHYVQVGFWRDYTQGYDKKETFSHAYVNAAGEIYFVDCSIITAYGQIETFDNEHTVYTTVKIGDKEATLGTSEIPGQVTCYILVWEDAGVSCTIMGDGSLDELMKVAESIY